MNAYRLKIENAFTFALHDSTTNAKHCKVLNMCVYMTLVLIGSNPFSMYVYRCVLACVNTYLEINTI